MFETLDEKFDVAPTLPAVIEPEAVLSPEVLSDEEMSRQALRDMIQKGRTAVDEAMNLATNSESARAYEVLAQMIKTVSDTSKDLLLLQKIKKDVGKKEVKIVEGAKTQNNFFAGTTMDFMKELRKTSQEVQQPPSE
jgi:Tfp pilus assembly protein PilF